MENGYYTKRLITELVKDVKIPEAHDISKQLITGQVKNVKNVKFPEAYDISWREVFGYDFSSEKRNFNKWENELDISHSEMDAPWDNKESEVK